MKYKSLHSTKHFQLRDKFIVSGNHSWGIFLINSYYIVNKTCYISNSMLIKKYISSNTPKVQCDLVHIEVISENANYPYPRFR